MSARSQPRMSSDRGNLLTRRALIGAGVAAGGAATLAACSPDGSPLGSPGEIVAVRVDRLPHDPDDGSWRTAPATTVELAEQVIALPHRSAPSVPAIDVRAMHDGKHLAFRLEWSDEGAHASTVKVDDFRDACAVLLGPGDGDDALRVMGAPGRPVTLLHWKADWQHDVDEGLQGLAQHYPNRCVDAYPPLHDRDPMAVGPADYVEAGATAWLPGLHVGNPLSGAVRSSPVEKLLAEGFSTTTTAPTQDALGRGRQGDGTWRVVLLKSLAGSDAGELALAEGASATCAFAVWSGGDGDAGGRKSPSAATHRLALRGRAVPRPF